MKKTLYIRFIFNICYRYMKTLWSPLVSDCSGAVGDVVAARNRYGSYMRLRNGPAASGSPFWEIIKDLTHSYSLLWADVPHETKLLWSQASNRVLKSYAFGQKSTLPGYNYYISCNVNLSLCGLSAIDVPPVHQPCECLISNSVSYDEVSENLAYVSEVATTVNKFIKVFATVGIGLGRTKIYNDYRLLVVDSAVNLADANLYGQYLTRFSGAPVSGKRLFFKSFVFDSVHCSQSQPIYSYCLT